MARIPELDDIRAEIRSRSHIVDWATRFPWWPRPAHVKILFYADGGIRYDGGPFFGLKQVLATLTAQHHPWVRFELTLVNRSTDPSADHDNLDLAQALALDDFDELWIYSIASAPQLAPAELAAARTFMDDRDGGVLITGDHADLGAAFGNLPRAGKMRLLPAPAAAPPGWNTSLRPGADSAFQLRTSPIPSRSHWTWCGAGQARCAKPRTRCYAVRWDRSTSSPTTSTRARPSRLPPAQSRSGPQARRPR